MRRIGNEIRDQLMGVMAQSGLCDTALISAVLRALLEMIEEGGGMNRRDAKNSIARSLVMFQD
jgi:hypothetical protein